MEIETFEVNEIREGCIDDKNELLRLATELGANGQLKILESGNEAKTFPYRKITMLEKRIYETIFTSHTAFKDFSESIIPVRIMQVAAHAMQYPETSYLTIWHNKSFKDPILLGQTKEYASDVFLLARWGEALESLNVLKQKAIEILRPQLRIKLDKIKSSISAWEVGGDARLENYLNGEGDYSHPQYFE